MSSNKLPPQFDVNTQTGMQKLLELYKNNCMDDQQGTSSNGDNAAAASTSGGSSSANVTAANKLTAMQQFVEKAIDDRGKSEIIQLLERITVLKPAEKLLLYLRMPSGVPETDPLKQPQNPLGTRSEINHTINWVRSHLEHDPNVSIPKQDVYEDYANYCTNSDIKPLSTADFGKVMKQVFPDIRPRRLGTRGNSRYCYAALRKTTKLPPPYLPEINTSSKPSEQDESQQNLTILPFSNASQEDIQSFAIIRQWATNLLNVDFKQMRDLSDYITKNNLNLKDSNSVRMFQKKILNKDIRAHKKLSEMGSMIKRRRKRRKNSLSESSPTAVAAVASTSTTAASQIDSCDTKNLNTLPSMTELIKIKKENDGNQQQPTKNKIKKNQLCDNNVSLSSAVTMTDKKSTTGDKTAVILSDKMQKVFKQEIHSDAEDLQENVVLCKKIRQVQEKLDWQTQQQQLTAYAVQQQQQQQQQYPQSTHDQQNMLPVYGHSSSYQQQQSTNLTLMKPPSYNNLRSNVATTSTQSPTVVQRQEDQQKIPNKCSNRKKPKYISPLKQQTQLQQQQQQLQQPQLTMQPQKCNLNSDMDKDDDVVVSTSDITIMPRERVISICNLDKDALDDYLNEGDNSQEQEAELLKYFQSDDNAGAAAQLQATANNLQDQNLAVGRAKSQCGLPLLENYQIYQNATPNERILGTGIRQQQQQQLVQQQHYKKEQITELRTILQQNLNNSKEAIRKDCNMSSFQSTGGNVASATLQMLSQRHPQYKESNKVNNFSSPTGGAVERRDTKRKLNTNARSTATSSYPNNIPRHCTPNNITNKDYNFVPISLGGQSPVIKSEFNFTNNQMSLLPSSNSASVNTCNSRRQLNKQQSCDLSSRSNVTACGFASRTIAPQYKGDISASAPASPSIVQQRFVLMNEKPNVQPSRNVPLNAAAAVVGAAMINENRSQSVPLHCQMPDTKYNSYKYATYASVSNSVAPTPIPQEYVDFNDDQFLNILNDTSSSSACKNENSSDLMMNLPNCMNVRNNLSRSVPSTPQPSFASHRNHLAQPCSSAKKFDFSKSVPTTPVALTPFRYSPETNRDFLINGNTVESVAVVASFYNNQAPVAAAPNNPMSDEDKILAITEEIDELSAFNDVADPIIGSDLLNNL